MGQDTIWVKIRADMADFNKKMSGMRGTLQRTGSQMRSVGTSMSLGLTAPLALFGASTLKAAADFETGMNRVKAMSGATGVEFQKLKNQAKELGATTQFSAGQAADAMGFLAMAGMEANKIFKAMPDTLNLAAAAQIDMGSAADIVTNILTGMQVPVEELPDAVDILAKAFTSANTDLLQLGQAMKFVGPVAGAFGVNMATTTAAIGLMSNAGIQASMAGTGFRQILSKLVSEQKKLGIVTTNTDGKLRPFADIIEDLEGKAFGAEEALEIFGQRAGPAMVTLLNAGSAKLRTFTADLADSGGTAQKIADVSMSGLNGAIKAVKSAFEAFQISLAESGMLEWVTDFAGGLAEWFRELSKTNPALLRMGTAIAAVVAVIGPLALIIGGLVTAAGALLGPLSLVVAALAAAGAGFAAVALKGKSANEVLEEEAARANFLVARLSSLNLSEKERAEHIEELNKIAPELVETLTNEGKATAETRKQMDLLNKSYSERIIMAAKGEEVAEAEEAALKAQTTHIKNEANALMALLKVRDNGTKSQKDMIEAGIASGKSYKEMIDWLLKTSEHTSRFSAQMGTVTKYTDANIGALREHGIALDVSAHSLSTTADETARLAAETDALRLALGLSDKETGGGKKTPAATPEEGGSGGSPAAAQLGLLTEQAKVELQIFQLQSARKEMQNDFIGLIRNAVAIRNLELGLIDQQIAQAEALAAKNPTDENLAKVIELNQEKLALEQKFHDDIATIKSTARAKSDEAQDAENERFFERLRQRTEAEAEAALAQDELRAAQQAKIQAYTSAVSGAMQAMGSSITSSLDTAKNGFNRFLKVMVGVISKLIAMWLSNAIASAIAGGNAAGAATGPAAPFTTPVFVATLVGGVISAFGAIPKFAKGGLVSGPTLAMVGDNPNASHDPEVISPLSKLKGMIGGAGGPQELFAVISGEDLYLSNQEYLRKLDNTN